MAKWSEWVGENCFTVGSDGSISKCIFPPKPKMPVHQSTDCILQHTEDFYRKRLMEAYKQLQESKQKQKQKAEESEEDKAQRLLSPDIVGVKNDLAFDQYCLSHNYK